MSTRSCIARKTGNGFLGVYHHWDGYPTALGATLFSLYRGHFAGDLPRMLAFLIDEHPAGWSSINGADFTVAAGAADQRDTAPCNVCGLEKWKHYSQYYRAHHMAAFVANLKPGRYQMFDHQFEEVPAAKGPQCYCHGTRSEEPSPVTESSDAGMEWAYVFDESARILYVFERLHDPDAGPGSELFSGKPIADMSFRHMTGMFGFGSDAQHWAIAAKVELDGTEPDWEHVSAAEYMASAIAA